MTTESGERDNSTISSGLLRDVRIGDDRAWQRMVKLYGPVVYGWSREAGLQGLDAIELVQDVFCAVLGNIDSFERNGKDHSFSGWLRKITTNKIRDEARRRKRQSSLSQEVIDEASERPLVADSSIAASSTSHLSFTLLHRAMAIVRADFSERTWQIFYRSTVEGHSAQEIAEDHAMTAKAVRQAKYRVLIRLREEFEPEFGDKF